MDKLLPKIEYLDSKKNYYKKITEVINSGNANKLFSILQELNNILTGQQNEGHFSPAAINKTKEELQKFIDQIKRVKDKKAYSAEVIIYLGGATQRLLIEYDNGKVRLEPLDFSPNTLQKWEKIK